MKREVFPPPPSGLELTETDPLIQAKVTELIADGQYQLFPLIVSRDMVLLLNNPPAPPRTSQRRRRAKS